MASKKYDALLKEYRKLAKRADQRLLEIERLAKNPDYTGVIHFGYARAQHDIATWSGKGAKRFNTKPPQNTQGLKAKIKDIEHFLSARTSTKTGIDKFYKERQQTINKTFGINLSASDMAKYFRSGVHDMLDRQYGSRTVMRAIGAINRNKKDIRKALRDSQKKDITIGDAVEDILSDESAVIQEAVENALSNYSKELRKAGIL